MKFNFKATDITKTLKMNELIKLGEGCYSSSLGWLNVDKWANDERLNYLKAIAKEIQEKAEVLVLIGIGGSNQGARAVIDALGNKSNCKVVWAGNTLSSFETERILKEIEDKDFCINVIAKNFETLEPGVAFRIFRAALIKKYGTSYNNRVYTTGTCGSYFDVLSKREGYTFLTFPEDIGGRYSIFSDVGLLPIAVAGIDIDSLVKGAKRMQRDIFKEPTAVIEYAAMRNYYYEEGYKMEMLSFFEPRLFRFAKWWTQLMAESEGKDNKGLYPIVGSYSEDLHSIGQFIQDGSKVIFETFISVKNPDSQLALSNDEVADRFDYLADKTLFEVNKVSEAATIKAHSMVLPINQIEIDEINEENMGGLFYFFMYLCYLSGKTLGINPFDQPGVEAYKKWMFEGLGK